MILSEFICFNSNIMVGSKLYWSIVEFHSKDTHKIYWLQIIDALPKTWRDIILKNKCKAKKIVIFDYHKYENFKFVVLTNLLIKSLILADANNVKPTAQDYFEILLKHPSLTWKINSLIHNTTLDTKGRMLQYNDLHNIPYAKKMFFWFGSVTSPGCSFCKLHDETIMHLFMTA